MPPPSRPCCSFLFQESVQTFWPWAVACSLPPKERHVSYFSHLWGQMNTQQETTQGGKDLLCLMVWEDTIHGREGTSGNRSTFTRAFNGWLTLWWTKRWKDQARPRLGYSPWGLFPSDLLFPAAPNLLWIPEPPKAVATSEDQVFKYMSLWGTFLRTVTEG